MKLPQNNEMRSIDKYAINNIGIPGIILMEKAAEKITYRILEELECKNGKTVLFICGKGNNGGDGFAAARLLFNKNIYSEILLLSDEKEITGDAKINLDISKNLGIKIYSIDECFIKEKIKEFDIIVDGIFGTGLGGDVREPYKSVIEEMNENAKNILSIDIPSGVSGDTGKILGTAVKADTTVTLALPKPGLFLFPGRINTGKLFIEDIEIPDLVINKFDIKYNALAVKEAKELIPKRKVRSHKGDYGKLYVIAGSKNMTGAAYFTVKSAYEIGAGVVYACMPESVFPVMQVMVPEAVEVNTGDLNYFLNELENADCAVIGPGLGKGKNQTEMILSVLEKLVDKPVLIDADGLNNIAGNLDILRSRKIPAVITPHPAEMMRLTGISVKDILENTVKTAVDFAKEYNTIVVLKDSATVIASPWGEVFINTTGNSALSKGGSGDVLSGIIGGLISQNMSPFEAAYLGVFIHGLIGDICRDDKGVYSVAASDLCSSIYKAIKVITES